MRLSALVALPLLGALVAAPVQSAKAQSISVRFGSRLGPEISLSTYSPDRHGNWRTAYRRWTPVTLYDVNGRYYRYPVRHARAVLVYEYKGEYFLPPQEQGWRGMDHRYNYRRVPTTDDYGRARPYTAITVDPRLGPEIGVFAYSQDRAGDWRRNFRNWTPVTVYEVNGRYYGRSVSGARAVEVYRYGNEYFLPPDDPAFDKFDRRFNYKHYPPSADDRGRVRVP